MFDIIFLIGGIAGIVVALAEVAKYNRDPQTAGLVRFVIGIILIIASVNFLYFAPKGVGEQYAYALRNADAATLQRITCVESPVYRNVTGINASLLSLNRELWGLLGGGVQVNIRDQSFTPLANTYSITYEDFSAMAGTASPPYNITLKLNSRGIADYCVIGMTISANGQTVSF
jgi:hypothetical protein